MFVVTYSKWFKYSKCPILTFSFPIISPYSISLFSPSFLAFSLSLLHFLFFNLSLFPFFSPLPSVSSSFAFPAFISLQSTLSYLPVPPSTNSITSLWLSRWYLQCKLFIKRGETIFETEITSSEILLIENREGGWRKGKWKREGGVEKEKEGEESTIENGGRSQGRIERGKDVNESSTLNYSGQSPPPQWKVYETLYTPIFITLLQSVSDFTLFLSPFTSEYQYLISVFSPPPLYKCTYYY